MKRQRKAFVVYVNLDPTPGEFHTWESARQAVQSILTNRIAHYNPEVTRAPDSAQPEFKPGRGAFVVYVDLDPTPGAMHTPESAHYILANFLAFTIPHYNPLVSVAPDYIQPRMSVTPLDVFRRIQAAGR